VSMLECLHSVQLRSLSYKLLTLMPMNPISCRSSLRFFLLAALLLGLVSCSESSSPKGPQILNTPPPAQADLKAAPQPKPAPAWIEALDGDPNSDSAMPGRSVSFLPVWKLMTREQKQEFIAGYVWGWRDAAKVTEIAISYIKENPREAIEGLERVKALYDLSELKPGLLVEALDRFYANPENRNASLSRAVSAASSPPD
jgi:hypothetical protein